MHSAKSLYRVLFQCSQPIHEGCKRRHMQEDVLVLHEFSELNGASDFRTLEVGQENELALLDALLHGCLSHCLECCRDGMVHS